MYFFIKIDIALMIYVYKFRLVPIELIKKEKNRN